ncbi:DUF1223 domain-containing protein [Neolewinella lacunae]|uniref:DUF1223 domain-containing protein n=1 Tax=Neolewinella lacunae TaxID=1517758 RepID=A0A923PKG6_9BACT|nr:DUF1223 domain-containing protein [Neolewinella lacunae]MBC6994205.1 DUF1223 domain-containing protein [Neolewinella lacunae]MDN3634636.1 DUF1223 domain-containing protein [Neolewinella lacunae]
MKYLLLSLLVLPAVALALLLPRWGSGGQPSPAPALSAQTEAPGLPPSSGTAVAVLELFTSQGCSSCPPADALLAQLAAEEDRVIALSFHVDYWNYLGWADPYSDARYSARQRDYSSQLLARTYTPQLVINGQTELIGSRESSVRTAVEAALARPATVEVSLTAGYQDGKVSVAYTLAGDPAQHEITALLVQNHAVDEVKRGENRGRRLEHHNVVRDLRTAAAKQSDSLDLNIPADCTGQALSVVVVVQNSATRAIAGAARLPLSQP